MPARGLLVMQSTEMRWTLRRRIVCLESQQGLQVVLDLVMYLH